MATNYDSAFSFHEQLWYYYSTNRGKIRSRYNDLTRKFLAYNDSEGNPHAFLRKPQFEALERTIEFLDADVHGNCGAREKRHAAEMRRVRTKAWMQKQAEEEENGR